MKMTTILRSIAESAANAAKTKAIIIELEVILKKDLPAGEAAQEVFDQLGQLEQTLRESGEATLAKGITTLRLEMAGWSLRHQMTEGRETLASARIILEEKFARQTRPQRFADWASEVRKYGSEIDAMFIKDFFMAAVEEFYKESGLKAVNEASRRNYDKGIA